ncbi:MAG TPA: amino acid adenylation domain-containing protein [Polyangiaceae bacterium]
MSPCHQSFERHALATPEATAVRFRDSTLSYGELNARANQLAHHLLSRSIRPEDRVVVCLEPGLDIAVALLGILKAGAVYVPLDPGYPEERVRVMLEDTRPVLVLTASDVAAKLSFEGAEKLELDQTHDEIARSPRRNPELPVEPEQTAYVYYTSGTTGAPKGVMASQRNLSAYVTLARERYGITSKDTGPAIARFSFSISMFELLVPLAAGGTLVVLERAHVLDLERLSRTLEGVTYFHAGPSLLRNLLRFIKRHYADFSAFARVRHASSGGDMVPVEVLEAMRDVFPNAEVFVIYGCSEISCMGSTYPVPRDVPLEKTYVGKPFDGVSVRVVDEALRPVGLDAIGEVLFAGPGVVKGYLGRPELTSEKFVELDGTRFYRTGDLGRLDREGVLELVGRSDFQLKLGGMRIEPAEIEHHLRRAPGVENGVVVARAMPDGEKALVAYVVIDAERGGDRASRSGAIRRYLGERLPEYMVPSLYVELPALPLNHNMKIDRKALPEPPLDHRSVEHARSLREPETSTERWLAELWQHALGVDKVGLDDNFFDLGGHSLSALKLLIEIDVAIGVTLTGLEVLREPLETLAFLCDRRRGKLPSASRTRSTSAARDTVELFHFGPEQSLYGALHGAPASGARHAVLICAPLGHEYLRSHFVLQRLSRKLAAQGVPALRFHYYGCCDSLGDAADATLGRWQRDIVAAYEELGRRTRATRITAVGARLGATLLSKVTSELEVDGVVLWDPVMRGSEHRAELERAQRSLLRASPRWPPKLLERRGDGRRELLGATYSSTLLKELDQLTLEPPPSSCSVETLITNSGWLELAHLEDMLPDVGISRALGTRVLEAGLRVREAG